MSIVRSYTVRIYRCDICGWQDEWNLDWSSYGSVEMSETCPKDIPTMCSKKCRLEFEARMADGRIRLPKLKNHGYYSVVLRPKFGYPLEPKPVSADGDKA
jgi:hypothetical protein